MDARLRSGRRPSGAMAATGLSLLLAAVILGPVLGRRGFVLVGDMVFVPHQPWKPAWLGLDGGVPRAVPSDFLTWALTQVVPGDLVQKAVLLAMLMLAGTGAARLASELGANGLSALPAAVLYLWNPFVYERLAIGHWALL